jgi:SNF2 family DNA or RNA helicase
MPDFALMEHQTAGVKFLDSMDGIAALLWEPGVGKTGATLSYIDLLAKRQKEVRVLVVAPLTAADTWVLQAPSFMDSVVKARMLHGMSTARLLDKIRAAANWTTVPDMAVSRNHKGSLAAQLAGQRVTILSMSAGAVSSWCQSRVKTVQMLQAIRKFAPDIIVMDESHLIKAATSNISKAMYQIGQTAKRRIILTGTVNPHSTLDCYGQWRFLAPWTFSDQYNDPMTRKPLTMTKTQLAAIRPWPWGRFQGRYALKGGFKGKAVVGVNPDFIDELRDRVAERSQVVLKKDALDLPPTTDVDVHVTLSPAEVRAYNRMRDELVAEMLDGSLLEAPNALAKIMKLRQATAGFMKDTETGEVHVIGNSKRKAMIEVASLTLAGERRLVVAGYFRTECALLVDELRKAEAAAGRKDTVVEVITGETKANDRLAIRQRFGDVSRNPERTILVAQARTMSLSVNELVTAQNMISGSLSERRDDWVQLRGRLDRQGQTAPVTFWNVTVPDTVDTIMLERHKDRGNLETALLDHIRAGAAGRL